MTGLLLVLEGGEGSGKSTQAARLAGRLRETGREVVETHEPGATKLGAALRRLLLDPDGDIDAWTEVLVYGADRAQHVAEVIRPSLSGGRDVVSDRFLWSSLAYQGVGRGVGIEVVRSVNAPALVGLPTPLVVVLDLAPEDGLARVGVARDRIEAEPLAFHRRVRDAFLRLAADDGAVVVDAARDLDAVAGDVWEGVCREAALRKISL